MERGRVLTKLMKSDSERVVWPIEVVTKPDAWRRSRSELVSGSII